MGVATQCMKSQKCFKARAQYYANVCLKYASRRLPLSLPLRLVWQDQCENGRNKFSPWPPISDGARRFSQPNNCYGWVELCRILSASTLIFILGTGVIHPAPGAGAHPSFTALVANVDSDTANYIATSRAQTSRQEMIEDLYEMSKVIIWSCNSSIK